VVFLVVAENIPICNVKLGTKSPIPIFTNSLLTTRPFMCCYVDVVGGSKIEKNEMGGACSANGGGESCPQGSGG
jgi:hypothetical protein